jgi:hypothetical protein
MFHFFLLVLFLASPQHSQAWGKRGHSLICENGAYLVSQNKKSHRFLKKHSLDFGYYCNVPDLIWKRPGTYKKESTNHFMNLEAFERVISKDQWLKADSAFRLSRKDFNMKYQKIAVKKGRSWWRIQELNQRLSEVTQKLKNKKLNKKERHRLQADWLLLAGIIGHYVGDLAMPLHVAENYDGQMTGQKGLHHYFEEKMVAELYLTDGPGLQEQVYQKALALWPNFIKKNGSRDLVSVIIEYSLQSHTQVQKLLDIDKKTGRKNLAKALQAHKPMLIDRLVQGSLHQALIYYKHLGWKYNGQGFFDFRGEPDFMEPGL